MVLLGVSISGRAKYIVNGGLDEKYPARLGLSRTALTHLLPLGALLGLEQGSVSKEHILQDATLPWLFLSTDSCPCPVSSAALKHIYVLAKQGKSLHYQLWSLDCVSRSNRQLKTMDPKRANDGTRYVLPPGGVEAGLAGQAVLLHTRTVTQK